MNRQRHRLVFSRTLGTLVPAAESTRGRGKAASGARTGVLALGMLLGAAGPLLAQQLPVPGANFVTAGQAAYQTHGAQAYVNQVGNRAILNWQQFNVGAGHGVQFRQVDGLATNQLVQGASFTTLNRIWDHNPSVIAGALTQAAGQKANVILVNSNGIAFMGGAQVNLQSLTASTLNIADKYILNGLLGDNQTPQYEKALDGSEARGFVKVFEGARLTAGSQGRMMLIAPTVVNRGTIEAPDGQVILAAGTRAFLRSDDRDDLHLRGLLVEVDSASGLVGFDTENTGVADGEIHGQAVALRNAADDRLGHATNLGTVSAARGNVTMVGYAVNQKGIARATSSVTANGSVYLMAQDSTAQQANSRASTRGGQVVLGAGSVTEVLPELADTTTSVDGDAGPGTADPSQIRVQGQRVYVAGGASITTPGGEVDLIAVDNPSTLITGSSLGAAGAVASTTARVHVASGARIDVSGLSDVQVSAGRNTVEVELRGDELKDSPVNQSGPLRGQKVHMDIEQALANAEAGQDTLVARDSLLAYRARLERGIGERSSAGGTVNIRSEGEAIVESGATIDLSGGSVKYGEAMVKTTVLSAGGQLVDLADAQAGTRYDAIVSRYVVDHGRWNVKEVIELPNAWRVAEGYTEGKDAGQLNIQSMGAAYMQGSVAGRTVVGERQAASGQAPRGAQLNIGTDAIGGTSQDHKLNQNVVIDRARVALPDGFAMNADLPEAVRQTLTLDADLLGEGRVAELGVYSNQAAELRAALRAPQGGRVSIAAQDLTVRADIEAAGGTIALTARNNAMGGTPRDPVLTIADGVQLSTRGAWVNRQPGIEAQGTAAALLPRVDGGRIELSAEGVSGGGLSEAVGQVALGAGVTLDASGGALLDENGQLTEGRGGHIGIGAGVVSGLEQAQLSAYGLSQGGSLSLGSDTVQIGGSAVPTPGQLRLDADFFTRGGFARYEVNALRHLEVADGTTVRPTVQHRELAAGFATRASSADLAEISTLVTRADHLREATDIQLTAKESGVGTGTLRIGEGAAVEVEAGGAIALEARNTIDIQGTLRARGGDIEVKLDRSSGFAAGSVETNTLHLGAHAVIDASGVARTHTDERGLTQGEVLSGGRVALNAVTGYVVTQAGSQVDVSGTGPVRLDQPNEAGGIGRELASGAGQVKVFAEEGLVLDGGFAAQGGAPGQRGGTLELGLSKNARMEGQVGYDSLARTLVLTDRVAPQASGLAPGAPVPLTGEVRATVGTDALEAAGFDTLRFRSRDGIELADGLSLGGARALPLRELQLDAARIESPGQATLAADALRLGNYDTGNRTGTAGSSATTGTLSAEGRLLEVAGNVRLQGMGSSTLTGREQVQLNGVTRQKLLDSGALAGEYEHSARIATSGDLTLRGGVVTPGSFADVKLQASGRDVRIEAMGDAPIAPLAALGRLSVEAQNITQAGRLVAPLGQIDLVAQGDLVLAPGSITSVAAVPGQVLPLGQVQNGSRWVVNLDPAIVPQGQLKLETLPDKAVRLNGGAVRLQADALVDIAGGGELQAYEFSVGPGGSRDILADAGTYAILPGYQGGFAPSDPQESTGRALGEAVHLTGVPGLPDGTYTLLPAHYALLPGAMAVRLGSGGTLLPGQAHTRQDGVQVAAGYLTDTRTGAPRDADWRAIEVLTHDQVRARSEYTLSAASQFFRGGRNLPQDAGLLSAVTQGVLELEARLHSAAATGGRGASVDISAPQLAVVSGTPTGLPAGTTQVDVARLNALGADSLVLGATRRTDGADTTTLSVGTDTLTLANDAQHALRAPEVILAAQDTLTLRAGSTIDAQGAAGDAGRITTDGNGAFVRAAASSATFERTGTPDRSTGTLVGEAGSVVQAARSIALDATRDNRFAGDALFQRNGAPVAGELAVGASRVSLGQPGTAVEGITYSQDDLDALLGLDGLTLTSYSSFDLYGGIAVGGLDANGRPTMKNLTLQGAGIAGIGNGGATASLSAQQLTLVNTATAGFVPAAATGQGALEVRADTLVLGQGDKTIAGYDSVRIQADDVVAAGTGRTDVAGALTVEAARLSGESAARQTLATTGTAAMKVSRATPAQALAVRDDLGAGWTLEAESIEFDARAELASGRLALQARTGDVVLGAQAEIDVAGREVRFFDTVRGSWGGTVALGSASGNVIAHAGSRIDVSGAAGADAGELRLSAAQGDVDLTGADLQGRAHTDANGQRGQGARAVVDAFRLDVDNASQVNRLTELNRALNAGGFDGERQLRARTGDVLVAAGETLAAQRVTLSADAGSIEVAGTVSANGSEGGQVGLYAGQSVVLAAGSRVEARGTAAGADGGRVEIGTDQGRLDLRAGSTIDVGGGAQGQGGTLALRVHRDRVAMTTLDSAVSGARSTTLEAFRVYEASSLTSSGDVTGRLSWDTMNAHDTAYAANHAAIRASLGQTGNQSFRLLSGTEVRSSGDMVLADDWNLANSTAGGEAGVLTLRAGGDLNINNNLSDGFVTATAPYDASASKNPLLAGTVRGGHSWSYRLVAGADSGAANPMATSAAKDLTVAAGKLVRTGTGDIRMAAGQDIKLASNASVVYTAGRQSDALAGFNNPLAAQRAYFTQDGGDIEMTAGRDVLGAASAQLFSEWLFRQGRLDSDGAAYPMNTNAQGQPAWWVRFDQFRQGVGALGGGDVTVRAGGNVDQLSANAPTQGRMASATPDASRLVKTGGGNVTVEAGGDVMSGQFLADNGDVTLRAGGQVGSSHSVGGRAVYPVIALGDGQAHVRADGDVNVHAVFNPTLLVQSYGATDTFNIGAPNQRAQRRALFSTYGEDSGVRLESLTGDTVLHNARAPDGTGVADLRQVYAALLGTQVVNVETAHLNMLSLLPGRLAMTSFSGDVLLHRSASGGMLTMMPSALGQVELLARDSVQLNASLQMSDHDPAGVASVLRPTADPLLVLSSDANVRHAPVPVHTGDTTPAKILAVRGDVKGLSQTAGNGGVTTTLQLPKALEVRAGRDVIDLNLDLQHANEGDRSVIAAGRDIRYPAGAQRTDEDGVRVAGPGRLQVSAGRDIDLGTSGGLVSRGDLDNANLPATGVDIEVMAGVGPNGLDAAAALQRLATRLGTDGVSETDLWLVRWLTGDSALAAGDAVGAVQAVAALAPQARHDRVRDFLFTALRETGRDANREESGHAGTFDRGYAALELLFPGIGEKDAQGAFTKYQGKLNLFASRIKTERGGDIDILVPGGGMVVGLANTPANLLNVGSQVLGIVAAAEGNVRAATRDDMLVNQSRILTVGGGDVLLWSSEGDIDAGRGKKTATAVPPPLVKVDAQGNVTLELQGAASGSGIGALGTPAGAVDLVAPRGTVNAGDAGIRAGNLNVAAQVVLGADNISVTGTSTGTPVADTSAVTAASSGATTGGDDASRVVESLSQAAAESAKAAQELAAALKPSVVRVDVLGFGEE